MSNLRRYNPCGCPVFITSVTYARQNILLPNIDIFWRAFNKCTSKFKTILIAWAILPNHFHVLIEPGNVKISVIMHDFKLSFSSHYRKRYNLRCGRVWQLRFWDHIIRDEEDWKRHIDYIHYNPVRHKITKSPFTYPHSSIGIFKESYHSDWGSIESPELEGEFGE